MGLAEGWMKIVSKEKKLEANKGKREGEGREREKKNPNYCYLNRNLTLFIKLGEGGDLAPQLSLVIKIMYYSCVNNVRTYIWFHLVNVFHCIFQHIYN